MHNKKTKKRSALSLSLSVHILIHTSDRQKPKNSTPLSLSLSLSLSWQQDSLSTSSWWVLPYPPSSAPSQHPPPLFHLHLLPPPHSPSKPTSPPPPPNPSPPPPPHSPSTPTSPPPPPPPTPNPSPPPPPPPSLPTLLENIVSALLGAGDFRHWATLLSAMNSSSTLPPLTTATLFIPSDQALSHFPTTPTTTTTPFSFDPFLIPYHIIPQRLPFSALQLFQTLTRLPTLLPSNSILITKNSHSNFSVDGSRITHPDLCVNSAVAVHGIENVLDYSVYGTGRLSPPPPLVTKGPEPAPNFPCCGRRSDAAGLGCNRFPIVFVVVCAAFAFKIL